MFPGYETGSESDNPTLVEFDIFSCRWPGANLGAFPLVERVGLQLEIDDIQIYQTPANDIRIDFYRQILTHHWHLGGRCFCRRPAQLVRSRN